MKKTLELHLRLQTPLLTMYPKFGLCVPSSCSHDDVQQGLSNVGDDLSTPDLGVGILALDCIEQGDQQAKTWDGAEWVMVYVRGDEAVSEVFFNVYNF